MCGIAGFVGFGPKEVAKMTESSVAQLCNRGPDDSGTFTSLICGKATLGLAHTRLSIIDLSSLGHQPYIYETGDLVLVFNGEIYNYIELRAELSQEGFKFASESDTEVLATAWAHWGEDCLPKLEGMFAFAVYSKRQQTITLVRDAFGIKPLYFSISEKSFGFASTPEALIKCGFVEAAVDHQAVFNYLAWGQYDLGSRTFFSGVSRLEAGQILVLKLDDILHPRISSWWLPVGGAVLDISFEEAAELLKEKFLRSVQLHLRSDTQVGIALSGGVDSSAILGAALELEPHRDFEVFGYCAEDLAVSEEEWIDLMAQAKRIDPNKVHFGLEEITRQLGEMSDHQGEPFSSSRIFAQFKVFERAHQKGIKVVLEGQGGDELLAGYHGFAHLRLISLLELRKYGEFVRFLKNWSKWPKRSVRAVLSQTAIYLFPSRWLPFRLRIHLRGLVLGESLSQVFSTKELRKFGIRLNDEHIHELKPEFKGRRVIEGLIDALQRSYIPQLTRQGDRNAMAHSVENRVPFLSVALANFVLQLPERFLISPEGETKSVFKRAMRGIVPDAILDRKDKVGFETPQNRLWKSPTLLEAATRSFGSESHVPYISKLDASDLHGDALKWRYLNLGLWLDRNFGGVNCQKSRE